MIAIFSIVHGDFCCLFPRCWKFLAPYCYKDRTLLHRSNPSSKNLAFRYTQKHHSEHLRDSNVALFAHRQSANTTYPRIAPNNAPRSDQRTSIFLRDFRELDMSSPSADEPQSIQSSISGQEPGIVSSVGWKPKSEDVAELSSAG